MFLKNFSMPKALRISHPTRNLIGRLELPGSKSESNRLLILKGLYAPALKIEGLSNSKDTQVLIQALAEQDQMREINIGDAGTAMRFLTAYMSVSEGEWILDGSERMRERPIGVLVKALQSLGADIRYEGEEGFPPLRIKGGNLRGGLLKVDASVSSQYLSALMMIAPGLTEGLELSWEGEPVSMPYLDLTANIMRRLGFKVFITGDQIRIPEQSLTVLPEVAKVEPDWSAASYWFAAAALAEKAEIYLPGFQEFSLQGDSIVQQLMAPLGLEQIFTGGGIRIRKAESFPAPKLINLLQSPDLAQSLIPIYAAKGKRMAFKGLQTLRIKETDRLSALGAELAKMGAEAEIGRDYFNLISGTRRHDLRISTYGDHRMAMGFAVLSLQGPLIIEDPEVVEKSYPKFWDHCESLGFAIEAVD